MKTKKMTYLAKTLFLGILTTFRVFTFHPFTTNTF